MKRQMVQKERERPEGKVLPKDIDGKKGRETERRRGKGSEARADRTSLYRAKNITVNIARACLQHACLYGIDTTPGESSRLIEMFFGGGSKYSVDGRKTTRQNTYKLLAVEALNSAHVRYNPSPFPSPQPPFPCIYEP